MGEASITFVDREKRAQGDVWSLLFPMVVIRGGEQVEETIMFS